MTHDFFKYFVALIFTKLRKSPKQYPILRKNPYFSRFFNLILLLFWHNFEISKGGAKS